MEYQFEILRASRKNIISILNAHEAMHLGYMLAIRKRLLAPKQTL